MSTASTMLTTIDTAISALITEQTASVTIGGETYTNHNLKDLVEVRKHYAGIVAGETAVTDGASAFGISGLSAGNGQ